MLAKVTEVCERRVARVWLLLGFASRIWVEGKLGLVIRSSSLHLEWGFG